MCYFFRRCQAVPLEPKAARRFFWGRRRSCVWGLGVLGALRGFIGVLRGFRGFRGFRGLGFRALGVSGFRVLDFGCSCLGSCCFARVFRSFLWVFIGLWRLLLGLYGALEGRVVYGSFKDSMSLV